MRSYTDIDEALRALQKARQPARHTWTEVLTVAAIVALMAALVSTYWSYPKVRVIDGCEYIVTLGHGGEHFAHKGTCTNIIHRFNQ